MKAILLLGSNQQNPRAQLTKALQNLEELGTILRYSSVYITAAWGNTEQDDFYNQAVEIELFEDPSVLMKKIIAIEERMGRKRNIKWEPRIIDIDVISVDDQILSLDDLKVPHPHMHERMFVLKPLFEIKAQWVHPILKQSITELIAHCEDKLVVRKLN